MRSQQALHLARLGEAEGALRLSREACLLAERCAWPGEVWFRQCDHAELLLRLGRPGEALAAFTGLLLGGDGVLDVPGATLPARVRATEALLCLGSVSEAHEWLQGAYALMEMHGLLHWRGKIDALASRF